MVACRSRTSLLVWVFTLVVAVAGLSAPVHAAEEIVFVDWSWESAQVHNRIAGFILEHGYSHPTDYLFADTPPGLLALRRGDAHVSLEMWIDNYRDTWDEMVGAGEILDLGRNFPDAPQGWYVPTYMIEGDEERGIEPVAPDLRSVADLPKYWELFRDPEMPNKGRLYNCPAGWLCADINNAKLEAYGLDETYATFGPGSDSALVASLSSAYQRGLPWLGYYWEPTWVLGMYDMTLLEEPEYSDVCWENDFGCAYPPSQVVISMNAEFAERNPHVREFLEAYETSLQDNNEVLAYMQQEGASTEEAARWFLENYEHLWTEWIPADVAEKVRQAL